MTFPGVRDSAYSALERWLHWLALEPAAVRNVAFELESHFFLPRRPTPTASAASSSPDSLADGAVYVCGLARSGTTMLLRILDEIDALRSLTYADMPFVLAPNLWKRITKYAPRSSHPKERAHGDGILVDFDSPEGFEEVFWRTFGKQASDRQCLGDDEPSPELLAAFANYRILVANPRAERDNASGIRRRYLSKNNNNLLRLRSLCKDPTATVLLVYRNPVATARSLHRQHQRFCAVETGVHFTRAYMGWLGHHEFGLDHRPFCFAAKQMDPSRTPDDANYWLDYWNAVYRHVLTHQDCRLNLVNHDAFCAQPTRMLQAIFAALRVEGNVERLAQQIVSPAPDTRDNDDLCPELLQEAERIHQALLSSRNNLP